MSAAASHSAPAAPPRPAARRPTLRWREAAASLWLAAFTRTANHAPFVVRWLRRPLLCGTWHASPYMRENLLANAAVILGSASTPDERRRVARGVLDHFYRFICELATADRPGDAEWTDRIAEIVGADRYAEARADRRGAILVTAHLGSFELGIAALRDREPRIHVVFRRDVIAAFERLRQVQHRRLGVAEAAVDDGLAVWMRLRDALRDDEIVLVQGDRVLPGQKGLPVPFCGATLRMPSGPVKLAMATGAPLIPVFAPLLADGRVRIHLEPPIETDGEADVGAVLRQLAAVIERYVRAYPDQWLMVHRAFDPQPSRTIAS